MRTFSARAAGVIKVQIKRNRASFDFALAGFAVDGTLRAK